MSNKAEGIFSIIGGIGYGIYTLYNRKTSTDYALNALMSGDRGFSVFARAENYGATQDKFFYFNIAISVAFIAIGIYYIYYKKDYYCPHCKSKIQKDATKCLHCTSDIINNNNYNFKNQTKDNKSNYISQNLIEYNISQEAKPTNFKGDKELTNDAYKLYLVNKFKVTKNDVFNKFVYQDKLFESLDELLIILDNEENKKFQTSVNTESINTESYNEFVRIRTDCLMKITKNGTSVKTEGSYPNMKWSIINEHGSSIKQLKNLQELIDYAKLVK